MSARTLERLWEGRGAPSALLRALLVPASWPYGAAVALRGRLYDRGWLPSRRAPVAVVSVGNVRVGGTGKTPFVIWLVARLRERGSRPVVLSRGYAGKRPLPYVVHPDGDRGGRPALDGVDAVGVAEALDAPGGLGVADEPLLIAARAGCPVVVGADRVAGADLACRLGADVVVLDDGFQHRRLHRDLDIVLLADGDEHARLLPAGPLREPVSALARAGVVIHPAHPARSQQAPRAAVAQEGFVADVREEEPRLGPEDLRGREVLAVAGIARPARFRDSLEAAGVRVRELVVFADHHHYDERDWRMLLGRARGLDCIVTTEKDLVKLRGLARTPGPGERGAEAAPELLALRTAVEVADDSLLIGPLIAALEAGRSRLDRAADAPHDRQLGTRR